MGYETKLIIGVNAGFRSEDVKYFSKYAEIDLCCCGSSSNILKLQAEAKVGTPEVYWFSDDGNTRVTKDRYDEAHKPLPIKKVLKALRKDAKEDSYRRYKWAIGLLNSMVSESGGENLEVVFFGH